MLWDTEVRQAGDGSAVVVARKPVAECGIERVLAILGLPQTAGARWTAPMASMTIETLAVSVLKIICW